MIYFIQGDTTKRIKIGRAASVDTRLRSLQTAFAESLEILGTMPGERPEEIKLHNKFAFARIRGEWFQPHESLLQFIAENATPPAPLYTPEQELAAETAAFDAFQDVYELAIDAEKEEADAEQLSLDAYEEVFDAVMRGNAPDSEHVQDLIIKAGRRAA